MDRSWQDGLSAAGMGKDACAQGPVSLQMAVLANECMVVLDQCELYHLFAILKGSYSWHSSSGSEKERCTGTTIGVDRPSGQSVASLQAPEQFESRGFYN